MAGGIFITQNKIRPGFYHKFTAAPRAKKLLGELGVAALPLVLDWGRAGIVSIDSDAPESEYLKKLGRAKSEITLVRECMKRARTLLFYRLNEDGKRASLDMNPQPVVAAATCKGLRGNDIRVQIEEDEDNAGTYVVRTFIGSIERDEQRGIVNVEDIVNNDFVEFSGSGAITAAAGGSLTGGENGQVTDEQYENFLRDLEGYEFNAFGLPDNTLTRKEMFVAAAKRYIEEQGRLVQCIVPDYAAGYEAVTSIKNGVVLEDGSVIDKVSAVAWMTGAAASAGPATSLTYTAYDNAVSPDKRLNDDQIKAALSGGNTVFVAQKNEFGNEVAVIEQDVNTLTRFTAMRPQAWAKNRVVRALFYLVNSLTRIWHLYYIGKVDNNELGRALFKSDLVILMNTLVDMGAFENFDPEKDITISKGEASDAVVAQLAVRPVDAMEKMYFTVEVQ